MPIHKFQDAFYIVFRIFVSARFFLNFSQDCRQEVDSSENHTIGKFWYLIIPWESSHTGCDLSFILSLRNSVTSFPWDSLRMQQFFWQSLYDEYNGYLVDTHYFKVGLETKTTVQLTQTSRLLTPYNENF